jgi:hypothetical protein
MMCPQDYEPILLCNDYGLVPDAHPFYQEFPIDSDISVYRFLNPNDKTRILIKFDRSQLEP